MSSTAASTDIHKTPVRNCDAPVITREIALPCSPKSLGEADCARDRAMDEGVIRRVLAQVEVSFSNSMIEAFWRSLRHQWLCLHSLESFGQLEQLIDFYVKEHNTQMPHHAFVGQTPDEIYFSQGDRVHDRLTAARRQARRERIEANRRESCRACAPSAHHFASVINAVANAPP